jgi:hypothetical protein
MKNEKFTLQLKNKSWTHPKIKSHEESQELRVITSQTQNKNPEPICLNFLTPLTQSVEKIVNLHEFK